MSKGIREDMENNLRQDSQRKILNLLGKMKKGTFKNFCHEIDISKPTLTKCIKELESQSMIQWSRDPEDRRSGYYELTQFAKNDDFFRVKFLAFELYVDLNVHLQKKFPKGITGVEISQKYFHELKHKIGEQVFLILLYSMASEKTYNQKESIKTPVSIFLNLIRYKVQTLLTDLPEYSSFFEKALIKSEKISSMTEKSLTEMIEFWAENEKEEKILKDILFK